MAAQESLELLVLDLVGTFAFALNRALTAVRAARLNIVGVVTRGMITAAIPRLRRSHGTGLLHVRPHASAQRMGDHRERHAGRGGRR